MSVQKQHPSFESRSELDPGVPGKTGVGGQEIRLASTPLPGQRARRGPQVGKGDTGRATSLWRGRLRTLGDALRAFFFRNARQEMPETMRIGRPQDYGEGVDIRWRDPYDLWIVRNASGIYALRPASSGPWPVVRIGIRLDEAGEIVVDRRKTFRYEAGEWACGESFLQIP